LALKGSKDRERTVQQKDQSRRKVDNALRVQLHLAKILINCLGAHHKG